MEGFYTQNICNSTSIPIICLRMLFKGKNDTLARKCFNTTV